MPWNPETIEPYNPQRSCQFSLTSLKENAKKDIIMSPEQVKKELIKKENGYIEVAISSWRNFHDLICEIALDMPDTVWRGQRCDNWVLEPTIDRILKDKTPPEREFIIQKHLKNFQFAIRGRRGPNPAEITNENEWWALGQHNGLSTPLLDWTSSPFVALYFAFYDTDSVQTKYRAIFGVDRPWIEEKSQKIKDAYKGTGRPPICQFIHPMTNENARLVSQGGLFTRTPTGVSVENWVKSNCVEKDNDGIVKILIPDKEREQCLQALKKMNINHLSLFPDVYGASTYCNVHLNIKDY